MQNASQGHNFEIQSFSNINTLTSHLCERQKLLLISHNLQLLFLQSQTRSWKSPASEAKAAT